MIEARSASAFPLDRSGIAHRLRILQVHRCDADFKLKYSGSALGYVWSVIKPLSLFTVLYLVFGRDLQARTRSRSTTRSHS